MPIRPLNALKEVVASKYTPKPERFAVAKVANNVPDFSSV